MLLLTIMFVNCDSFDSMYVSYIPRNTMSNSKIISIIYLELIIVMVEFFMLIIPALIIYPYFKIDINSLSLFIYILIYGFVQISITLIMISILSNNFTSMIGFIVSFILQIINLNFKNNMNYISNLVPTTHAKIDVPYVSIILFGFSIIFYKIRFNQKNIN